MYQTFMGGLAGLPLAKHGKSRAVNAENPMGKKEKEEWLKVYSALPGKERPASKD